MTNYDYAYLYAPITTDIHTYIKTQGCLDYWILSNDSSDPTLGKDLPPFEEVKGIYIAPCKEDGAPVEWPDFVDIYDPHEALRHLAVLLKPELFTQEYDYLYNRSSAYLHAIIHKKIVKLFQDQQELYALKEDLRKYRTSMKRLGLINE